MSRKRRRRPPPDPIDARVDVANDVAQCGRCGQLIIGPDNVLGRQTWGYRLDGDTWRPTAHHRAQRLRAREAMQAPDRLDPAARDTLAAKLRDSDFRRGGAVTGGFMINNQFIGGSMVECPSCSAINRLPARAD